MSNGTITKLTNATVATGANLTAPTLAMLTALGHTTGSGATEEFVTVPGFPGTVNAANFGTGVDTNATKNTLAVAYAVSNSKSRVLAVLPYDPTATTFNTGVRMVREGGDWKTFDIKAYGADPANTGAKNDAAFAAAIAGAGVSGGIVWGPNGTYKVTVPVTINKHQVRLLGENCRVLFAAPVDNDTGWWTRGYQIGVSGFVINQLTASTDGVVVQNGDGTANPVVGVELDNIAVAFGGSAAGSPQAAGITTGHAFNVKPPSFGGVTVRNSIVGAKIGNLIAYGHSSGAYGFRFEGINTSTFGALLSYGGGGLLLKGPDGNSTFAGNIQIFWQNPGAADAIFLDGASDFGGAGLNLNWFSYLQANADFGLGNSSTSYLMRRSNLWISNTIGLFDYEIFSGTLSNGQIFFGAGHEVMFLNGNGQSSGMGLNTDQNPVQIYSQTGVALNGAALMLRSGAHGLTSADQHFYIDHRGRQVYGSGGINGSLASPISCAASTGIGGFNGGVGLTKAKAYLRIPSTAFTAGTPVTFYSYWDGASNASDLRITPYTTNGNDLGAQFGVKDNSGSVAKEIQIIVYPLRSATYALDIVCELQN